MSYLLPSRLCSFPLVCVTGNQQWSILGSHHRRRIPALWGESRLCQPVPQIHERCPPAQGPLRGGEDSWACREAENTQQEQVEKLLLLVLGCGTRRWTPWLCSSIQDHSDVMFKCSYSSFRNIFITTAVELFLHTTNRSHNQAIHSAVSNDFWRFLICYY